MYVFIADDGQQVEASLTEFARSQGLSYESVKALAYGRQASLHGWRCLTPMRSSKRTKVPGCNHVLHRWRHPEHGERVCTVAELSRTDPKLSPKALYQLASRGIQRHHGWEWIGEVACWPRRLLAVIDPKGAVLERVPLDLLREEGLSIEDVEALLRARPSGGWRPYLEAAGAKAP